MEVVLGVEALCAVVAVSDVADASDAELIGSVGGIAENDIAYGRTKVSGVLGKKSRACCEVARHRVGVFNDIHVSAEDIGSILLREENIHR